MERLCRAITGYIQMFDKKSIYRVDWRVYHGWFAGKTKTEDRLSFERYLADAQSIVIQNVSFSTNFGFSECLLCHTKRNPLYDSLRTDQAGMRRQRMVDTSLVCDLLHSVRSRAADLYLVVGDDDDLFPAICTAEAWGAKIALLHQREFENKHVDSRGVLFRLSAP
jgi:hypothetical protein